MYDWWIGRPVDGIWAPNLRVRLNSEQFHKWNTWLSVCFERSTGALRNRWTVHNMTCVVSLILVNCIFSEAQKRAEMKKERWARVKSGYCNASKWKRKWIQWQFNGPFVSVNSIHKTTCCRELTVSDKWNMVGVQWGNGRARWRQLYQFHSQCTTGMMRYDTMTFTFHIYQFHSFFFWLARTRAFVLLSF